MQGGPQHLQRGITKAQVCQSYRCQHSGGPVGALQPEAIRAPPAPGRADYSSHHAPRSRAGAGGGEPRGTRWELKSGRGPYPPRPGPAQRRTSGSGEPGEGATARGPGAAAAAGAGPGAPRRRRLQETAGPCSRSSAPRRRWAPRVAPPAPSAGPRAASPSLRPAAGSPPHFRPSPLLGTPPAGRCL